MLNRNMEVRKRITVIFAVVFALFGIIGIRLIWLQLIKGSWYYKKATENRIREVVVDPKRGTIYDRNGNELAVSIDVDAVYAIPAEIEKSKLRSEAATLASILDMKEDDVYERLSRKQQSVWIKLDVTPEQSKILRSKHLAGIGIVPKPKRFYPKKNLAAHILGIAGDYNQGLEGIEATYDKELSGVSGRLLVEYDATNHEIPNSIHRYLAPREGESIVLTIDQTIQYIAERELDKVMNDRHPKAATIIVMDPNTGEILALANRPDFDPNNYQKYPASNRRNIAISNSYEPGSTFKVITLSAALEEGVTNGKDRFYCNGAAKVGSNTVRCTAAHGSETLAEVVQNSCNPGFITLGLRVGVENFYKYVKAFGLGKPLGVDLAGEASGILMDPKNVRPIDLACMSIGQVNTVTPLQLLNALCVIANGGKLMQPHLIKEFRNNEGKVVQQVKPKEIRQVVTKETAKEVQGMLEKVVSEGTGSKAAIEGYDVGGKTGTAQKPLPGGGYSSSDYVASFIGFAPVDKPRLAVLVLVDSPQGYPYYGGTVAAPLFKEVMQDSLRYLGEPRRYQPNELNPKQDLTKVPSLLNLSLKEAMQTLTNAGLKGVPVGAGDQVYGQIPVEGIKLRRGSQVLLNLEKPEQSGGKRVVPDLKGKSMRDVAELLGLMDLVLIPDGNTPTGVAVEQRPAAGQEVAPGTQIYVRFQPPVQSP